MEDALRNAAAFRVAGGQVADEEVLPDVGIKTRDLRDQILGVNHFNPETAWITMQITRCFTKYVFFCLECLLIETTPSLPKKGSWHHLQDLMSRRWCCQAGRWRCGAQISASSGQSSLWFWSWWWWWWWWPRRRRRRGGRWRWGWWRWGWWCGW